MLSTQASLALLLLALKQSGGQSSGCSDDAAFTDELGSGCAAWAGYDCADEAQAAGWGHSSAGLAAVRDACPLSCGLCAAPPEPELEPEPYACPPAQAAALSQRLLNLTGLGECPDILSLQRSAETFECSRECEEAVRADGVFHVCEAGGTGEHAVCLDAVDALQSNLIAGRVRQWRRGCFGEEFDPCSSYSGRSYSGRESDSPSPTPSPSLSTAAEVYRGLEALVIVLIIVGSFVAAVVAVLAVVAGGFMEFLAEKREARVPRRSRASVAVVALLVMKLLLSPLASFMGVSIAAVMAACAIVVLFFVIVGVIFGAITGLIADLDRDQRCLNLVFA